MKTEIVAKPAGSSLERDGGANRMPEPQRLILALFDGWCWLADRSLKLVFWVVLLLMVGLALYAAPHRIHRWMLDTFLFLDGGWRILNGQRPYADFATGLGPVTFQIVAFGMLLSKGGPAAIDFGFIYAGLVLGIWCWFLCKERLERPAGIMLALFVALFTFSPHAIGSRPSILTYASIYNRLGYALLVLIVVEAVRPTRYPNDRVNLASGISSGVCCSLLFFVKPTFFLVAVFILTSSFLFIDRRSVKRRIGLLVGLATPSLAMLAYLRFDIASLMHSLTTVAASRVQAKTGDVRLDIGLYPFFKHAFDKIEYLVGLLLLGLLVSVLPLPRRVPGLWNDWWPLVAALAICGIEPLFLMTNGTQESVPLLGVFALLLVSEIYAWHRNASYGDRRKYGLMCGTGTIGGLLLFLPNASGDVSSLVYTAAQTAFGPRPTAYFGPSRLQALATREVPSDWDEPSNDKYIRQVNEGMALIRKVSDPAESVFTLDYVNPFSYALARKPAVGGGPYLGSALFNSSRMPSPDWFLGQVDILMIGKDPPYPERVAWLNGMFGKYIEERFIVAAESPSWYLLRRRTSGTGTP